MRAVTPMALVLALAAVLATSAAGGTTEGGIELSTVTVTGKVHFLASFDAPFTYALSPTRDRFAYVPGASGSPSEELRISDLRGPDVVVRHAFITDLAWAPAGHPIA